LRRLIDEGEIPNNQLKLRRICSGLPKPQDCAKACMELVPLSSAALKCGSRCFNPKPFDGIGWRVPGFFDKCACKISRAHAAKLGKVIHTMWFMKTAANMVE
jgi:hypothetical protein